MTTYANIDPGTRPIINDYPAYHAAAVTPSDTVDLTNVARALYVGAGGNVTLDCYGGETAVLFVAVPTGTVLPVLASRVRATGTTATSIVELY